MNQFARALSNLGVEKGDKVAMILPNIPQLVIANLATWRIGAVAVLNNPLYTERELAYQLDDSDSTVVITLSLLVGRVLNILPETRVRKVIGCHINSYLPFPKKQLFPHVKKDMHKKIEPSGNVLVFKDLIKMYSPDPLDDLGEWDALSTIIYTGGTTGLSKGVMLSISNISCNVQQFRAWSRADSEGGGYEEVPGSRPGARPSSGHGGVTHGVRRRREQGRYTFYSQQNQYGSFLLFANGEHLGSFRSVLCL